MYFRIFRFDDTDISEAIKTDFDTVCLEYLLYYLQSESDRLCEENYELSYTLSCSQYAEILTSCYKEHFEYCNDFVESDVTKKLHSCGYDYEYFYKGEKYEELDIFDIWEETCMCGAIIDSASYFEEDDLSSKLLEMLNEVSGKCIK